MSERRGKEGDWTKAREPGDDHWANVSKCRRMLPNVGECYRMSVNPWIPKNPQELTDIYGIDGHPQESTDIPRIYEAEIV